MPKLDRSMITKGALITLDAPQRAIVKAPDAPPRYGQKPKAQSLKPISDKLDDVRKKLDVVMAAIRNAKRGRH